MSIFDVLTLYLYNIVNLKMYNIGACNKIIFIFARHLVHVALL